MLLIQHTQTVQWILQVMPPSACCFIVCWFSTVFHYMFRPTWPSSSVRSLHIFIFVYLRTLLRCFLVRCLFLCGHTLHVFHLCFVPVLFSFVFFGVFLLMRLTVCSLKSKKHEWTSLQTDYFS
jgi:hypothetical protein